MSWVQLDDNIANHPKILVAGPAASWLWACAIAYCNKHLTDGYVTREALATLGNFSKVPKLPVELAERLVEARKTPGGHGLFERRGDDYYVHDYLAHNASKEVVLERRAKAAARKAKERDRKDREKQKAEAKAGLVTA